MAWWRLRTERPVEGCASVKLRENILQVSGMSMANILKMGRSKELSKVRTAHMEAALQKQVKTEPMNVITTAITEKKKSTGALSQRLEKNDKMSRKRRAKKRDIHIGDHVLVRNRQSGSKFLLPFEKDPWLGAWLGSTLEEQGGKTHVVLQCLVDFLGKVGGDPASIAPWPKLITQIHEAARSAETLAKPPRSAGQCTQLDE
ncbi:hypothetical protein NDU88_001945 [Pleurodeles waltl]|uniref:Uncharacterized protein n=1 Tax=Pleurodeles waltl TaxID=8319 RepID=A0AAV7S8U5_PLEWA|nr:hypothetical protein NDU88_001945 [Pleurodeles waltl]